MYPTPRPIEVIAMHGWASDSRCWTPWIEATRKFEWHWQCGERGYGGMTSLDPEWSKNSSRGKLRVVIGHSLGPHLVAPDVLEQADAVVLLASFGTFVPPDRAGRRVRTALDGMAAKLDNEPEAKKMLEKFLANAAAPQSSDLLPPGPADGVLHLDRLRADLEILRGCQGLPRGFPGDARVLLAEAGDDRIVDPAAQLMLREALPGADILRLQGTGHALLGTDIITAVADFVESMRRSPTLHCGGHGNALQ